MNEKRTNEKKDGKGGKKTMGNGCRDFPRGAAMSLTQRDTKYVEKQKREGRQINDGGGHANHKSTSVQDISVSSNPDKHSPFD